MKILYYFQKYETAMFLWQISHIIDELAHHNIEVEIFDPLNYATYDEANEKLLFHLKSCKTKYDLFMTDQNKNTLYPDTVIEIRRLSIPRLLIHFDNLMEPRRYIGYALYFDAVMLLNKDLSFDYSKYQCQCIVAPYAANPYYFSDMRNVLQVKSGICFIGTPYGTRCFPINKILQSEILVDLYADKKSIGESLKIAANMSLLDKIKVACSQLEISTGRKVLQSAIKCKLRPIEHLDTSSRYLVCHDAVDHCEMNQKYSQYSLSLSMPEARNTGVLKHPVDVVRLRNFEIPMCAGLQITRYYEELAEYFCEDKEIVFYRTDEELIDKVKYYIDPAHQQEVDSMKTAARYRAENEHTWYQRFSKVFQAMGLNYKNV